jgi:predicted permease
MLIINVIVPVFGMILIGTVSQKFNILGTNANRILSNFVYFISLPSTLFLSGARTPVTRYIESWHFILAYGLATFVIFLVVYLQKNENRKARIVNAMSAASPNTAFMGIPVILTVFGQKGMLEVIMSTLFLTVVVVVAIVLLDSDCSRSGPMEIRKIFAIIYKNPLVLSIAAGVIFSLFGIPLPKCIDTLFSYLSSTTGPLSLFAIGMTLTLRIPKNIGKLIWIDSLKLIAMPLLTFILLKLFHASELMMATGLVLSSMPVAVTSYIIAQRYNTQVQESSDIVISSTVFSIITLSVIMVIISAFFPEVVLAK